ncbi:MAG: MBL fold metallo-hydrolase [Chloroflexi bacterium]|nr:MBL fold metallo-hydrolase [Chloroflexota bacterium]
MQLVPGLHQIGLGYVNAFLWDSPDGLVLIDAGVDEQAAGILAYLTGLGRQPSAVRWILITHSHPDHIGGAAKLKEVCGAQVLAHRDEVAAIESSLGRAKVIDRELVDGEGTPGGLKAIHTPGHTRGHTCYYHPRRSILFVGDALTNREGLAGPSEKYTADMPEAQRSIRKLSQLSFEIACFGHGEPLTAGACTLVDRLVERMESNR